MSTRRAAKLTFLLASLLAVAAGLVAATPAFAVVLVDWDMTGENHAATFNATTVDPGLATPVTLSSGSGFDGDPGWSANGFLRYRSSANSSTFAEAVTQKTYFEFTLAATAGNALNVSSIVANKVVSQAHTRTVYIASSLDGYASVLGTASNAQGVPWTVSLGSAIQNQTAPVTLRIYYSGYWGWETVGFGTDFGSNPGTNALQVNGTVAPFVVTKDWNGTTTSDWATAANWTPSGVPGTGDSPYFGKTGSVGVVNTGASARTVAGLNFVSAVGTTISGTGAVVLDSGATPTAVSVAGTHAINAPVTLNSDAAVFVAPAGQLTLGNISQGSAGKALSLDGTGTLVISGTAGYTGATSITGGGAIDVTGTLGNTAIGVPTGTLSLRNAGAVSQNTITVSGTGSLTQTVANAIGGTTALTVSGGTATLSSANNFSGATTLSGGTLNVTAAGATGTSVITATGGVLNVAAGGSITGGSVAINDGATLGGAGTISVPTTVTTTTNPAILSPHVSGLGASTLTLSGGLTAASASFNFNFLPANVSDKIIASDLTLSGTEVVNVAFPNGLQSGTYEFLHYTGTLTNTSLLSFNAAGTAAVSYEVLAPGAPGNTFTNSYALKTQVLTSTWTGAYSGTWDTATDNWTGLAGTKFIDGQPVIFDAGGAAQPFVTIDGSGGNNGRRTSSVEFNSATSYTISAPDNGRLILDNGSGTATIHVAQGSHAINGAVVANSNVALSSATGSALTITVPDNTWAAGHNPFEGKEVTLSGAGTVSFLTANVSDWGGLGGNFTVSPGSTGTFILGGTGMAGFTTFTGQLSVGAGSTLTLTSASAGNAGRVIIDKAITGTGALVIGGTGRVQLQSGSTGYASSTFSSVTVNSGAELRFQDNGSSSVVAAGVITGGGLGTGPLTLKNNSGLNLPNWQVVHWSNALNLDGSVTIQAPGNGLFFDADASKVTTLTANTTLSMTNTSLMFGLPTQFGSLNLNQQITGAHSLTIINVGNGDPAAIASVNFGNASSDFSGGVSAGNASKIGVGAGLASTVVGAAVTSGPLGTGVVTLHSGGTLQGYENGNAVATVSNSILVDGNATITSGHSHFVLDTQGAASTFTFSGTPTLTNATFYGDMNIRNYQFQGTGFTLEDNYTPTNGGGGPLLVYSPNTTQDGMTTSVTIHNSTLGYNVGDLSAPANFKFGQQAINLNGGTFQFQATGAVATLTNAINVAAAGGTVRGTGDPLGFSGDIGLSGPITVACNATSTVSGNITETSAGAGSLTKTGTPTLTLAGANNTFSGPVSVQAGTLEITGKVFGNNATTLDSAANLVVTGSATFGVDGGVAHLGILEGGTTTLTAATDSGTNAGAQLYAEHIRQTSLTIGDKGKVTITGGGGASGTSVIGTLTIALPGGGAGGLSAAAVPEPGTLVLLAIAGLLGLLAWRRK